MIAIDLSKRIAVITGATGQLGRVMARTLAECGADVAIHYRQNQDMARQLETQVQAFGVRTTTVQADVAELDSVMAMKDHVGSALGEPDIIVNNAVVQYDWTTVLEQAPADFESQFRTCVLHNVHMAKAFVPAMISNGRGRVVGINTECAMMCTANQGAYVSGKRGMDGVLRTLAAEVGKHEITVNQVAPGWTISDKDRGQIVKRDGAYERQVPLGRRGTDQEIANVVAFLCSDLASFITGAYIPVCGGNVMPAI